MKILEVECSKCKVSSTCPKEGSSPMGIGVHKTLCRLLNGYGRTPMRPEDLSAESLERAKKDGFCLTLAVIPEADTSGRIFPIMTKIFHELKPHPREKSSLNFRAIGTRSV